MDFILKMHVLSLLLIGDGSCRSGLNPAVMENHPMGNEIAAWSMEWNIPFIHIGDHEHTKPTDEMIVDAGYPAETHTVVTEDGYILRLHRIPHAAEGKHNGTRPIVFLMHGLLSSSWNFLLPTLVKLSLIW